MRFQAQAVRHSRPLFVYAVGGAFALHLALVGLALLGWYLLAVGLFAAFMVALIAFAAPADGYLRLTPHLVRVGRVERPRSEWGRLTLVKRSREVVLEHRKDGKREYWVIEPVHAARAQWFVDRFTASPRREVGSEEAIPAGLKQMTGRRQPE